MYISTHKPEDEVDGDELESAVDSAANLEIAARLLRRNFATKNYAETRLEDWESRLEMGHETESGTRFRYGQAHLWEMLLAMDHRMILPEIHPGWHTICDADMSPVDIVDAGIHYVTVPREHLTEFEKICIDIDLENAGDDFILQFARRFPSKALKIDVRYAPSNGRTAGRVNTDASHWKVDWNDAHKEVERKRNNKNCFLNKDGENTNIE